MGDNVEKLILEKKEETQMLNKQITDLKQSITDDRAIVAKVKRQQQETRDQYAGEMQRLKQNQDRNRETLKGVQDKIKNLNVKEVDLQNSLIQDQKDAKNIE